jgi:hypothetical protein
MDCHKRFLFYDSGVLCKGKQFILVRVTMYVMSWTVRSIVLYFYSFSILIYYLWTFKYTKIGQILEVHIGRNVSFFWFFFGGTY